MGGGVLIQITPQLRILVAIEAIDGRKGIDSLAQLCRERLDADPFSGCLFIFRSRSRFLSAPSNWKRAAGSFESG